MFEYFEKNYPWNLAVSMTANLGGNLTEIDDACRGLKGLPADAEASTDKFFQAFVALGARLEAQAVQSESQGHKLSAANKYKRACVYYMTGERAQRHSDPARADAYQRMLACFQKYIVLSGRPCERVEVPFQGDAMPALFIPGVGKGPRPCMIHFDGLDVMKELLYFTDIGDALAARGVSCLIVDHPGAGEALRLRNMKGVPETEFAANASLAYLKTRTDVDADAVGIMALSLGGYYAPRAAAMLPAFKCCVAWGAMFDFGTRFNARVEGHGTEKSVPNFVQHTQWVFGADTVEEALRITSKMSLREVAHLIRCPILITHGENDRQVPQDQAQRLYDACVNSPRRELKIHRREDGGSEHCSVDNFPIAVDHMADWIGDTLIGGKK